MTKKTPARVVLDASHRWIELVDDVYPIAVLATAFANWMTGQPVWLLIVAPASSGKTLFIDAYARMRSVYALSALTSKTFASGLKSENDPGSNSLLHWLKKVRKHLLTLKDFGTVLSLAPQERNEILAQLREIYDGRYAKAWGTGERFEWEGKLGLIAAGTPKVDELQKWSAELGERFVQIRPISPDPDAVAERARKNKGREKEMASDLISAHSTALHLAREDWKENPMVPDDAGSQISALAQLVALARTPVSRDRYSGGWEVGATEGPARLAGVFEQLFRAAYVLYGREVEPALALVRRVAVDSIAPRRRHLVLAEVARSEWGVSLDGMDELLRCDAKTAARYFGDLHVIGLLEAETPVKKLIYSPSAKLLDLAQRAFLEDLEPKVALKKLFDLDNNITYEGREEEEAMESVGMGLTSLSS